jgi:L-lactate dehydrogenase
MIDHMARVGIIGTGSVGVSVAVSTLHAGFAQEVLLHDLRTERAEGEAMDLAHGAAFYPPASVRAVPLAEMFHTDAVVIAAGRNGRPDESRLALLNDNVSVIAGIGQGLRGYAGLIVVVTNPVDILTREMTLASGLPPERVLGTGTMLDSARLRQMIGVTLGIAPQSVHAQVVGEHGDSEVVLWSSAKAGGVPLRDWPGWSGDHEARLAGSVRTAAYEIIKRKGSTNHAIGLVTAALLRTALRDERRVLTVSRLQGRDEGQNDVAFSLPAVVGRGGATQVVSPDLNDEERRALAASIEVLRSSASKLREYS